MSVGHLRQSLSVCWHASHFYQTNQPHFRSLVLPFCFTTVIAPEVLITNRLKLLHHRNFTATFLVNCWCFRLQNTMSTFVGSFRFFSGQFYIRRWRLMSGVVKSWQRLTKVAPIMAHSRLNRWSINFMGASHWSLQ